MLMAIVNLSGSLGAWHLELWWRREKDGEAIDVAMAHLL